MADILKITHLRGSYVTDVERITIFEYLFRRLANHQTLAYGDSDRKPSHLAQRDQRRDEFARDQ